MCRTWVVLAVTAGLVGCSAHEIKYSALIDNQVAPNPRATIVYGSIEESHRLMEQAQLPHCPLRQRRELERQAGRRLTDQLGSPDYIVIGEIHGSGTDEATPASLASAVAEEAAQRGGDVVLVYQSGVEERPYAYTSPGYSRTTVWGSGYRYGPYRHGRTYAQTTYMPGQTYTGVDRFPWMDGLVFKYAPGVEQVREAMYRLDDARLEQVMAELEVLAGDESISFEEGLDRWREAVGTTPAPQAVGVRATPPARPPPGP